MMISTPADPSKIIFSFVILCAVAIGIASMFFPYYQENNTAYIISEKSTGSDIDKAVFGSTISFIILIALVAIMMFMGYFIRLQWFENKIYMTMFVAMLAGAVSIGLQIGGNDLTCKKVEYKDGFALFISSLIIVFLVYAYMFTSKNTLSAIKYY